MISLDDVLMRLRAGLPAELSPRDLDRFVRQHRDALERNLDAALAEAGFNLFERYGPRGAPRPGERGHRAGPHLDREAFDGHTPCEVAERTLGMAWELMEEPEFFWAVETPPGGDAPFTQADLPLLLGVPHRDHRGLRLAERERIDLALEVVDLAMEADPARWGSAWGGQVEATRAQLGGGGALPRWAALAVLEDALVPHRRLRLVNVGKATATDFIARHHRHLPQLNARGLMYALGACYGGRLVAVATAGHPTGRWAEVPASNVIELSRVASDGTVKNAASMLVARLLDIAPRSVRGDREEGWLFVTYQLAGEPGAPYRALKDKGLRPVACVPGRVPGGARRGSEEALARADKLRWEAGPLAMSGDWGLVEHGCGAA
ncbi:MAG: hypothetical protein H6740_15095 [Alphaproteobacteria bacterium]|nr:hypothetical protein [Alphaproteobacteria bacterium]